MADRLVRVQNGALTSASTGGTVNFTEGTALNDTHLLMAAVMTGTTDAFSVSAGWTELTGLAGTYNNAGAIAQMRVFVARGNSTLNGITVTKVNPSAGYVQLFAYSGYTSLTPLHASSNDMSPANTVWPYAEPTPVAGYGVLMYFLAANSTAGTSTWDKGIDSGVVTNTRLRSVRQEYVDPAGQDYSANHTIAAARSGRRGFLIMPLLPDTPTVERSFFRWNGTAMVVQRAFRWTGTAYKEVVRAVKDMRPMSPALRDIIAILRSSGTQNVKLAGLGSSTMAGSNATAAANRWLNLWADGIRTAAGASGDTSALNNTAVSTSPGLYVRNGGAGGTTAANYVDSTRHGYLTTMQPHICVHMVGSNDFSFDVTKATYKTNLQAQIDAIDAEVTVDPYHLLVHPYQRWDDVGIYPWTDYRDAMREIADANPARIGFIDLNPDYTKIGIPNTDPLNYIDTDNIHQNDAGHSYMSSLMTAVMFP